VGSLTGNHSSSLPERKRGHKGWGKGGVLGCGPAPLNSKNPLQWECGKDHIEKKTGKKRKGETK